MIPTAVCVQWRAAHCVTRQLSEVRRFAADIGPQTGHCLAFPVLLRTSHTSHLLRGCLLIY